MAKAEFIRKVNAALEQTNGHVLKAALCLGLEEKRVKDIIWQNPSLRMRWYDTKDGKSDLPLSSSETLCRTPIPEDKPPTDEEVALAMASEDKRLLHKGLQGFGLTRAELEQSLNLQEFGRTRFRETIEIINASIIPTRIKLLTQQTIIQERLEFVRAQITRLGATISDERTAWVNEEKLLMSQYCEVVELASQITDQTNRGAVMMAMLKIKTGINGKMKPAKPGFSRTLDEPEGPPEPPDA